MINKGNNVYIAKGAIVIGDVTIGDNSGIWYNCTVRGDDGPIIIGENTNIQDNSVLHLDPGSKLIIGSLVTIGHGSIIHGCSIGDNTLVGMGSIIMNDAVIGNNCIIGAGSLITPGTVIPDCSVVMGHPGKIKRMVTPEDIDHIKANSLHYAKKHKELSES